jgi:hypothetical protein
MPINTSDGLPSNPEQNPTGHVLDGDGVRMQVFDCFAAIDSMQNRWDEFVESLGCDIFMTYDWCRVWWKHYGGDKPLMIFVFYHRESIVGLLPTYLEKMYAGPVSVKVARIVGTPYVPVEVNPPVSGPFMRQVVTQWLDRLYSEFNPDIVCVGPISGTYDKTDQLNDECVNYSNGLYDVNKINTGVETIFKLGSSWDEYLSRFSANMRRKVNRVYRDILKIVGENSPGIGLKLVTASDLPVVFEEFVLAHNLYWEQSNQSGHFNDWPKSAEFHREAAEAQLKRGRLRMFELYAGNSFMEYEYAYKFSDTYFHFLNARTMATEFSNVNVGVAGLSEVAKKAICEGVSIVNSMRGKYDYKLRMGGELVPIHTILIFRKGILARLRVRAFRCLARLIHIFYYRIWFCRVAPKLPWRRRPLRNIWIKTNNFAY